MSRILLFVQTGDTRPTCVRIRKRVVFLVVVLPAASATRDLLLGPWTSARDRWWLVECENAEAGRSLIAESLWNHDTHDNHWVARCLQTTALAHGRVVASGAHPAAVLTGGGQ